MTRSAEHKPATVPLAQQAGEILARWRWVEPSVWTVRMLATLEQGVEGGKWFRLFDKVFAERNLQAAFQQVASKNGAAGVDHVTVAQLERGFPETLWEVSDQLKYRTYQPQSIRRVHIPKPGSNEKRPLGIPTVRDRMVQAAVVNVIEPIFERDFAEQSYGFRPGRGCKDALRRVDGLLKAGYVHVVDADLKGYFDSIPHDRLLMRLKEKIADGPVLSLIESFLKANILDGMEQWTPIAGAPQGAVLSPLLSNIYLDPLDHLMARLGIEMIRYADDFVILCRTPEEASRALELVRSWVAENGLTLHPTKTKVVDARTDGFDFLGYHFEGGRRRPREKSLAKLKATIRAKTRRTNGTSLAKIIASLNRTLRGWFEYFKHSRRWIFGRLDGMIRRRLRSLLSRRQNRRKHGAGKENIRWPNAFFAKHGLFSLAEAHAMARQSSLR
jgi:RNA-directed DNA polymerase